MASPLPSIPLIIPTTGHSASPPGEVLRSKMQKAILVEKTIFGGGRLGRFVLRVSPAVLGDWQAGQYIGIGLDTPSGFVVRSYSIASSPLDREVLEFCIALVPQGKLTPTIFRSDIGSTWYHLLPRGSFTLHRAAAPTLLMVATGTGIAPFISQLRSLWRLHRSGVPVDHRLVIIHGASYADELGYGEELGRYAAARAHGFDLTYIPCASRPTADRGWTTALGRGRVDALVRWLVGRRGPEAEPVLPHGMTSGALATHLGLAHAARTAWLASGNPHMVAALQGTAREVGVGTFLAEAFWKAARGAA